MIIIKAELFLKTGTIHIGGRKTVNYKSTGNGGACQANFSQN